MKKNMAFFHSNFMLQISNHEEQSQPSTSLPPILPSCSPQDFHVAPLLGKRSPMPFSTRLESCRDELAHHGGSDEASDDGSHSMEKKRRLNMEQVKTLEKNFELGTKLEPERKLQLAQALGLEPRQVAIWFQNRRARWKTKQLERDYELLKREFEGVKAENDALLAWNEKLHAEILALKTREPTESINLNKETEGSSSNRSENSSEKKLGISINTAIDSPLPPQVNPIIANRSLFPPALKPSAVAQQLFHVSSRAEAQSAKMEGHNSNNNNNNKEESLCNMFCGEDDQTGFWPWLDQHHFN